MLNDFVINIDGKTLFASLISNVKKSESIVDEWVLTKKHSW